MTDSSPKIVASIIPWGQVCKMLDKVQNGVKEKKKEMLLLFIDTYRKHLMKNSKHFQTNPGFDSFFPVMRILLPGLDRDRGAYGVKEKKLADLYIKILGLRKDSNDGHKLLNYRKPKTGGGGAGDFAEVAFYVLKNRCPENGSLFLSDVDKNLTIIAENYAAKLHDVVEKTVLQMLRAMSANEQKWLIRVLLKDMHLGIGQASIFNAWHPDAKDFYDVNNSLLKVCSTLQDPAVRLHEIEVSLFSPFRPMLAERAILEKVEIQMKNKTFFVETKYDGERSQIHKKATEYKYFSRNGFDFTANFGETPHCGLFTPSIHSLFLPDVNEAILDGEMIGWSQKHKTIITKAENLDVKNLKDDGDYQVCFCIFDLLYLNGKVLTNLPLRQRLDKIPSVVKPMEGRLIIAPRAEVTSKDDVIGALNEAIDNREEGVVLKDPDSVYQPASRKSGWIKVKPDYVDSLIPELDLLIIGGYYGTGKRQGVISHFLVAVAVPNTEDPDSRPKSFHSVCRVGSGYTVAELENLIAKLSKFMTKKQPHNVFVNKEKPHIWIQPEKSAVLQIRAAEITKSDSYKTGITLRFPRVETIRSDKAWHEILDTKELEKLATEASGKLASKHYVSVEDENSPPKKKLRQNYQPSLPSCFAPADVSKITKKGNLLAEKEFCVMSGSENCSKQELETLIAEHGGTFSQHPGENTFCILTNKETIRCKLSRGSRNVVKPIWLLECLETGKLLPWSPIQVFYLLPEHVTAMNQEFNQYGDSYYEPTSEKKLKIVLDHITLDEEKSGLSIDEMCSIDELAMEPGDLRGLFRRSRAFFTKDGQNPLDDLKHCCVLNFRLHGGTIESQLTPHTTHIIVPDSNVKYLTASDFSGKHVVPFKWVSASIQEKKLRSERMRDYL